MTKDDKLLFLQCLEDAGVSSWEGYEEASEEFYKIKYGNEASDDLDDALVLSLEEDDYE